ncbi:MAG: cytochrome C, partial [Thermodesulfovibrionales bacterium]
MRVLILLLVFHAFVLSSFTMAEEVTYRKHIKPIFDKHCHSCHGKDSAPEYYAFKEDSQKWMSKGQGMRMDTYSHLIFYTAWPDTGSLMRRLDDGKVAGKEGNMYKYLGSTEEE